MNDAAAPAPESPARRCGLIAIVGKPNVGKSTLMNALLGEALSIVSPTAQTTRHRILGVLRHGDAQLGLLDTPGLHAPKTRLGKAMNHAAEGAAGDADVVVFVTDPPKTDPLRAHPDDLRWLASLGAARVVLAVNKVDKVRPRERLLPLLAELGEVAGVDAFVPISAERRSGLDRLLAEVCERLPEGPALWEDDALTDRPVKFWVAEYVRGAVLEVARQEVPHATAVSVERYDESGKMPRIFATIHVEREGQKVILVGKGGAGIKRIGTRARERIEQLLGHRVHLELFVRETPGWVENASMLVELGYEETSRDKP